MGLISYLTGALGTLLVNAVQQKYHFSVKTMLLFGAIFPIMP